MTDSYPGDSASPRQMLALADEYVLASERLYNGHTEVPLGPFQLTTIHAIELYLSAVLVAHGHKHSEIRGLGHDLVKRAQLADEFRLGLRKRTIEHLSVICANQEYLASRYAPEGGRPESQANRLIKTRDEVAKKAKLIIEAAELKQRPAPLSR